MPREILEEKRNIIIFGQGVIGRNFHRKYYDGLNFAAYCDNDPEKHHIRCFGLDVISTEELCDYDDFSIVVCVRKHYEVARQLFNMGIKSFWLNCEENGFEPVFLDFNAYESLEYNPRRVWLKEHSGVGGNCYAIWKYAQVGDLDFVLTEQTDFALDTAEHYYAYHTGAVVVTQSMEDIPDKRRMELWHGFPIKAICKASNDEKVKSSLPYLKRIFDECEVMCSYSVLYNYFFGICCDSVYSDKFAITGMPRNDLLLRTDGKQLVNRLIPESLSGKIVVYAPTFRECEGYGYHHLKNGAIFTWDGYSVDDLEIFLAEYGITLLIKIHYAELSQYKITETKHIKIVDPDFLEKNGVRFYELLSGADMLISDYSSIWVDYLLLDRPIIFAVRDLEEYKAAHGLMIDSFDSWTPGEKVSSYETLKSAVENNLFSHDNYADRRKTMMGIYHKYTDGNSSDRVIEKLKCIIDTEWQNAK